MKWEEKIQMRSLKEELVCDQSAFSVALDEYDLAIEYGLKNLSSTERTAIFYRFWEGLPIARIADEMRLSWDEVDLLIDSAIKSMRVHINSWREQRKKQKVSSEVT